MGKSTMSAEALEAGTGIGWDDLRKNLDSHDAQDLDHAAIARLALDHIVRQGRSTNPEWWAQSVAIAYEHHRGLRVAGQRFDGTFSVTASRTVAGDKDEALAAWRELADSRAEFADIPVDGEVSTSSTEKWRYWRRSLADGSKVVVMISTKPAGDRSTVAVEHENIGGDESGPQARDTLKAWWKDLLARL